MQDEAIETPADILTMYGVIVKLIVGYQEDLVKAVEVSPSNFKPIKAKIDRMVAIIEEAA